MFVKAFSYILCSCIISFLICLIGVIISFFFQGTLIAQDLFTSYVFHFDGILIWGFGYGLLWFVRATQKGVLAQLNNVLEISQKDQSKIVRFNRRATSPVWANLIAIPITVLGGIILWNCGYPLEGFAKFFLAACSISLYYAGGYLLAYFIFSVEFFHTLDESGDTAIRKGGTRALDLEALNLFFIIVSTVGVAALYLAFRGTLTANFVFLPKSEFVRKLMVFPLITFLPAPLFYSFYPRYVLKRIVESDILRKISAIENSREAIMNEHATLREKFELEKTMLEIKDRLLSERGRLSILSLKDTPSLLLALLMFLQFIVPRDGVVSNFLNSLLQ